MRFTRRAFGRSSAFPAISFSTCTKRLSQDGRFQLVTFSHEPAVGFAADGASRITNGLGVCVVTYGAGGLNLLNSIACAYAEESPLIVITGGPGKSEKRLGVQVHHEVKSYDSQFKIFQEVTEFGAVLDDPRTAVANIRKAIEVALKFKRPVYLEVPRDMVFADVSPMSSVEQVELRVDAGAVEEAAQEIVNRLRAAKNPVLIVGVEVHRFHLIPQGAGAGRAPADSRHLVVSRPRGVSDSTSAIHRHLSRRCQPAAAARNRRVV